MKKKKYSSSLEPPPTNAAFWKGAKVVLPRRKPLAAVHEAISDPHDAGFVDTITMQEFDQSCLAKEKSMTKSIHIEGNNGGDYLTIIPLGGNLLQIEVGHCCAVTLQKIVPVEFLTALITNSIEAFGIEEIINQLWGKHGPVLCAQVKDIL